MKLGPHWMDFPEIWFDVFFFENPLRWFVSLKYGKNNAYFTEQAEKIKTYILWSISFFLKSCRLWDNVGIYGTARQATDDNIVQRTEVRFTCRINDARMQSNINTYYFSTLTKATRTRLNVTLYVNGYLIKLYEEKNSCSAAKWPSSTPF